LICVRENEAMGMRARVRMAPSRPTGLASGARPVKSQPVKSTPVRVAPEKETPARDRPAKLAGRWAAGAKLESS